MEAKRLAKLAIKTPVCVIDNTSAMSVITDIIENLMNYKPVKPVNLRTLH